MQQKKKQFAERAPVVSERKFKRVLGALLNAAPLKRDEVKIDAKKPAKIIASMRKLN